MPELTSEVRRRVCAACDTAEKHMLTFSPPVVASVRKCRKSADSVVLKECELGKIFHRRFNPCIFLPASGDG